MRGSQLPAAVRARISAPRGCSSEDLSPPRLCRQWCWMRRWIRRRIWCRGWCWMRRWIRCWILLHESNFCCTWSFFLRQHTTFLFFPPFSAVLPQLRLFTVNFSQSRIQFLLYLTVFPSSAHHFACLPHREWCWSRCWTRCRQRWRRWSGMQN